MEILRKEIVVDAPLDAVWRAWTTEDGLRFVSSRSRIDLKLGGFYEWFLDGAADDDGIRGSTGSRVLAFSPAEMIAFDWTFPPDVPSLRRLDRKTQVVVLFDEFPEGGVRVRLRQSGWELGEDWRRGFEYFDRAWGDVLNVLKASLEGQDRGEREP